MRPFAERPAESAEMLRSLLRKRDILPDEPIKSDLLVMQALAFFFHAERSPSGPETRKYQAQLLGGVSWSGLEPAEMRDFLQDMKGVFLHIHDLAAVAAQIEYAVNQQTAPTIASGWIKYLQDQRFAGQAARCWWEAGQTLEGLCSGIEDYLPFTEDTKTAVAESTPKSNDASRLSWLDDDAPRKRRRYGFDEDED